MEVVKKIENSLIELEIEYEDYGVSIIGELTAIKVGKDEFYYDSLRRAIYEKAIEDNRNLIQQTYRTDPEVRQ
jgi:hypothetical protein